MKEFMDSVEDSVTFENQYIANDDDVYGITLASFFDRLRNSPEFYENRTKETMQKVLKAFLKEEMEKFKDDAEWYIENVIPLFLVKELR